MPEPASFDLDPQRSRLARRLRVAVQTLTGLAATASLAMLLAGPGLLRVAAAVASVAALAAAARPSPRSRGWRLLIQDDGALQLIRRDGSAAAATVVCLGATHACLRGPDGLVSAWSDALPAAAWRRLRVACRWPAAAGLGQTAPLEERTK